MCWVQLRCEAKKIRGLVRQEVSILIGDAIFRPRCLMTCACGIDVYAFVGGNVQEIVEAWVAHPA